MYRVVTTADRRKRRSAGQSDAGQSEAERCEAERCERVLTLKLAAEALPRDIVLHEIFPHFNPFRLRDLRHVLLLHNTDASRARLSDADLKCYFEDAWQFRRDEFALANWQEMEVGEVKDKVRDAQPKIAGGLVYPASKVHVDTLKTREDIVGAYPELKYVPAVVYTTAVAGAHVLRLVEAGEVPDDGARGYLERACHAGLEAPVICWLAEKCDLADISYCATPWAAGGGHTDVLDLLASKFSARVGVVCLVRAAAYGQDAMINHLVEKYGVDPSAVEHGQNALHEAVSNNRVRTVKLLVEKHNVDIHTMNGDGKTALDRAWIRGWTECVAILREYTYKQLLAGEYGGDVDVRLLCSAVKRGDDAMIDLLVEDYRVDPSAVDDDYNGWNALHFAAWHGRLHTVKHLLEKHKVDIHVRDMRGNTALDYAEERGRRECVAVLREYTYKQLLAGEYGGDVDVRLLCSAVKRGDDAMIDLLVEKYRIDRNAVHDGGRNALHYAVENGCIGTVKHLVEKHGVDMHARTASGKNALDLAEDLRNVECAAVLRAYTYEQLLADEYGGDVHDVRLLLAAVKRGDDAMIDVLVKKYGVDPNAVDAYGWMALHWAAFCGHVCTIKDLVEKHGVDMRARAANGKTALDLAVEHGRTECANLLRRYGARRGKPVKSLGAKTP